MTIKEILHNITSRTRVTTCKNQSLDGNSFLGKSSLAEKDFKKAGIKKKDLVVLIGKNDPLWLSCYLALASLEAIIIPLDITLTPEEKIKKIEWLMPDFVVSTDLEQTPFFEFEKLTQGEETTIWHLKGSQDKPDGVFTMVFSSGTGGKEKAIMLSRNSVEKVVDFYHEKLEEEKVEALLMILPMTAIYPLTIALAALKKGVEIVFADPMEEKLQDVLRNHPVELIPAVPVVVEKVHKGIFDAVKSKDRLTRSLFNTLKSVSGWVRSTLGINLGLKLFSQIHKKLGGSLRAIISGGATLNRMILKDLWDLGFTIIEGYGITEAGGVITVRENNPSAFGSVGKPLKDVKIEIGLENEVLLKTDRLTKGYYKEPELTEKALIDGWFHTGDLGFFDENGNLKLTGRAKDVIVLADERKKNPEDIEALYWPLEGVKDFAIVGLFSPDHSGDILAILIQKDSDTSEDEVIQAIHSRALSLDKLIRIEKIIFHDEIPRNKLGKVVRPKVIKVCEESCHAIQ